MNSPEQVNSMSLVARFISVYQGSERAHGRYDLPPPDQQGKGKIKGRAITVSEPVTEKLWEDHLNGKRGLGIIPIREDARCWWGAIDIDDHGIDLVALEKRIGELGLPLTVCRSKSAGAHLYAFFAREIQAAVVRKYLSEWAALLGYPKAEIFPKQTALASEKDVGNWINMPYFDHENTNRYAVHKGEQIDAEKFLDLAEKRRVTAEQMREIDEQVKERVNLTLPSAGGLEDGPPCLQTLYTQGIGEGYRNIVLFNSGVYARLRYGTDAVEQHIEKFNQSFVTSLEPKEVSEVAKSLLAKGKEYFYQCKQQPLLGACQRDLCKGRKFGIGHGHDIDDTEVQIPDWPELPEGALYGVAGEWARFACAESEADEPAVLMTFLTWAGAMIGNGTDSDTEGPHLMIGEDRHDPRLFVAVVGATARARKGTSMGLVERIMKATEAKRDTEIFDAAKKIVPLRVTPGPLSSGEGVIYAIRDASDKMLKIKEKVIDPVSGKEKETGKELEMPEDPGVTDKRLLVTDGELGGALDMMQREGNTVSAILRTAWDGRGIEPLTKNSRIRVTRPHLCIVGHITRDELSEKMSRTEVHNGFVNRFSWCGSRRSKRVPFPATLDGDKVSELALRIAVAISKAHVIGRVHLAPEARDVWMEAYPKLTEERGGTFGAATSRAEAQVLRMALIYTLLDGEAVIRDAHLKAALALWSYCEASARYLFERPEDNRLTKRVIEALKAGPMTQSELNKALKVDRKDQHDALRNAMQRLQESGRVAAEKQPTGGRPVQVWRLGE